MSCYIIDEEKIDLILNAIQIAPYGARFILDGEILDVKFSAWDDESKNNLSKVGKCLIEQNIKSYNYRYNEEGGFYDYKYKPSNKPVNLFKALVALDEYEYQSCETKDYRSTNAFDIVNRIRKYIISSLPQYRELTQNGWS